MRKFMREKGKKQEGQRNVLPPQIFNGEQCRGDFEDFDIANEDNVLEEFLGLPRKKPKIELVNSGRVAEDAKPRKVGKLDRKQVNDEDGTLVDNADTTKDNSIEEHTTTQQEHDNAQTETLERLVIEEVKEIIKSKTKEAKVSDGDLSVASESSGPLVLDCLDLNEDMIDILDDIENVLQSEDPEKILEELEKLSGGNDGDSFNSIGEEVDMDNAQNKLDTRSRSPLVNGSTGETEDGLSDSDSDFTDSESDDEVRYMSDGEVQRKPSRGFKLLKNSKRFWKATLMMGHA